MGIPPPSLFHRLDKAPVVAHLEWLVWILPQSQYLEILEACICRCATELVYTEVVYIGIDTVVVLQILVSC